MNWRDRVYLHGGGHQWYLRTHAGYLSRFFWDGRFQLSLNEDGRWGYFDTEADARAHAKQYGIEVEDGVVEDPFAL